MLYRDFKGLKLSALGMGTMRLPTLGDDSLIDEAAAGRMVALAMEGGVNYYDTAWGYHDGNSEIVMGRLLSAYPRESFFLATKFPGYDLSNMGKAEEIFEAQLKKCGVDYFDFYLIHNVCEKNVDAYLDERYGILSYLRRQREAGRIRHMGFSAHGSIPVIERFLKVYGDDMEFCQIQLNYVDWEMQGAKDKVRLLNERGLPVWVMEPMRGGRLASLSEEEEARLRALRPDESIPGWAFRFLQTVGVTMILTGSSSEEQMKANLRTMETDAPLSEKELSALLSLADEMAKASGVPCTGCRYCVPHCPQGLDIPALLNLYNEDRFTGGGFIMPFVISSMPEDKRPSACRACKSCEAVCPQQIKISEAMAAMVRRPDDER